MIDSTLAFVIPGLNLYDTLNFCCTPNEYTSAINKIAEIIFIFFGDEYWLISVKPTRDRRSSIVKLIIWSHGDSNFLYARCLRAVR